jgi:uncharacterized caspase-like protein
MEQKGEKRIAILIGIDKYQEIEDIPQLSGAENDARELFNRLTKLGRFEVLPAHYLLGKDATNRSILKAISDVFRKDVVNYSLVVFYFSGHGMIDENQEGYIAPYDMYPEDPFVGGISMEDLRRTIYRSKNKASVVVILDCCYAGIAAKSTKGMQDAQTKHLYAHQLQKLIESPDENDFVGSEHGKIILASSEPNAVSRERNNCTHRNDISTLPHSHGAFTYHLIEGLDGEAANKDTGIITFGSLKNHIENKMIAEGRQKPIYSAEGSLGVENIRIAESLPRLKEKVEELISQAQEFLKSTDIQSLTQAAKKVGELVALDPENEAISGLRKDIDNTLFRYKDPLKNWLNNNLTTTLRLKIEQIRAGLYDNTFYDLVESLSYNELQNIDSVNLRYLIILCAESTRQTEFPLGEREVRRLLAKLETGHPQPKQSLPEQE